MKQGKSGARGRGRSVTMRQAVQKLAPTRTLDNILFLGPISTADTLKLRAFTMRLHEFTKQAMPDEKQGRAVGFLQEAVRHLDWRPSELEDFLLHPQRDVSKAALSRLVKLMESLRSGALEPANRFQRGDKVWRRALSSYANDRIGYTRVISGHTRKQGSHRSSRR